MFDSFTSDQASYQEPCTSCGGIGFGGCTCDEETMQAMDNDARDAERDA